jgi:alanine dehydrogenase
MKTLVLSHDDVSRLLPMSECVNVMEDTFRTLVRGDALQPQRQVNWLPDKRGALAVMPSYLGNPRVIGSKIVTVFPANQNTLYETHQGAVLLFECEHGRLLAVIDASSITAIRTAAVSAAATKLLAREDATDLTILGSGTQAAMHLESMSVVRPVKRVRIWSRNPDHAKRFVKRESDRLFVSVEQVASVRDAVTDSDIICTTTGSTSPVLLGKWLHPGVHVNAIGASVPPFRELDSETVRKSMLFVDRRESVMNEAEDIRMPMREGTIGAEHIIGELGEILLGRVRGRHSKDEITLFKSVGLAVEDLAAAHYVYRKAEVENIGTNVEFSAERANWLPR